jgi:hypothetical protein
MSAIVKLRPLLPALSLFFLAAGLCGQSIVTDAQRAASLERWDKEIAALEARDRTETHGPDSILFIGSSSIRLWKDIADGMAPYRPIQRGFGGSNWTDVVVFADRLIAAHNPRAFVFFVGNDITGRENDRTPAQVVALFSEVLATLRAKHPTTPVFYVAVTPSGSRFAAWPKIKAGNRAIQAFCEATPNTYFIPTESAYFDAEGRPRDELFVADRLHLNPDGYVRWGAIIKSHLDGVLGGALR